MTSTNEAIAEPQAGQAIDPPLNAPVVPSKDLEQFLQENNNALVSYVYSWVRSRPDALDIVQEAYCRICRLGDLSAVSHLRGYLFKTARNIATDWVRQRIVRDAFVQEEPLRGNREAASPEDIWLAREELDDLHQAVEALPPKCKLALMMVRIDGASYEDVGKRLAIKTHSARRLVERAMEHLLESKLQGTVSFRAKRRDAREAKNAQVARDCSADEKLTLTAFGP